MSELGTALLTDIQDSFMGKITNDRKLKQIANKIRDGTDYDIANDYSIRIGELLSESVLENTGTLAYMSEDLAREVLTPVLTANHNMVAEATNAIQTNMNEAEGIRLGVQTPELDTNRIEGLVNKVASYETYEQAKWVMGEPVVNYSQSVVDQAIRDNARVTNRAGGKAYIIRETEAPAVKTGVKRVRSPKGKVYSYPYKYREPCPWCKSLAGKYDYDELGMVSDVYRRHEACRCKLTFVRGNTRQNVWNRKEVWTEKEAQAQKKTTKAEERRLQRDAKLKEQQAIELQLKESGFMLIDPKIYKNADRELLKANVDRIKQLEDRFNIIKRCNFSYFEWNGRTSSIAYVQTTTADFSSNTLAISQYYKNMDTLVETQKRCAKSGWNMPIDLDNPFEVQTYSITHEYGHMIHNVLYQQALNSGYTGSRDDFVSRIVKDIMVDASKADPFLNPYDELSTYGKKNCFESFAEMFANSQGSKPNALGNAMRRWLESEGL